MNKFLPILLLFGIFITACKEDIPEPNVPVLTQAGQAQLTEDSLAIVQYMNGRGWTADFLDESGVFIIITEQSDDDSRPNLNDNVRAKYKGYELNNDVFDDSSINNPNGIVFGLDRVILGWQIGIPYLSKGSKGILLIPSYLAYGSNPPPSSSIGVDAPLIFEVELVDF